MLGLPPSVRIYYAVELVDMRNGIDVLRAKVEQTLRKDPPSNKLPGRFPNRRPAQAEQQGASRATRCRPRTICQGVLIHRTRCHGV